MASASALNVGFLTAMNRPEYTPHRPYRNYYERRSAAAHPLAPVAMTAAPAARRPHPPRQGDPAGATETRGAADSARGLDSARSGGSAHRRSRQLVAGARSSEWATRRDLGVPPTRTFVDAWADPRTTIEIFNDETFAHKTTVDVGGRSYAAPGPQLETKVPERRLYWTADGRKVAYPVPSKTLDETLARVAIPYNQRPRRTGRVPQPRPRLVAEDDYYEFPPDNIRWPHGHLRYFN